jgi:flagellar biosynthesis protein FlhA
LVRQALGFQIVATLKREDGTVPLVQLAPEWEQTFETYQVDADRGIDVALPPQKFNQLGENISMALERTKPDTAKVALVTSSTRRRFLRTLVKARGIDVPVLSFEEIGVETRPALLGVVAA